MTDLGLPGGVNPLDFLHKLATQRGLPRPDFAQVGEQGLPHNKVFVWQCSFYQVVAQGSGRSKKEAKVAAARAVRDQLNFNELPPPPTFQSQMERKLKRRLNSNGEFAGNGAESSAAKAQKYDYSLHFQCYRFLKFYFKFTINFIFYDFSVVVLEVLLEHLTDTYQWDQVRTAAQAQSILLAMTLSQAWLLQMTATPMCHRSMEMLTLPWLPSTKAS